MGNVPLGAFTGRKGILKERGYIQPGPSATHLLPTVHPSFIQRGQAKYSAPFMMDLQKAVELARNGYPFIATDYLLDPSPYEALQWARGYIERLRNDPSIKLAYDIETPGKDEDEEELEIEDDRTYTIYRIGFSYRASAALSIPWRPEYLAAIRLLLESAGDKVVWNAGFDNPRIHANGVAIRGVIHDGMVAWHILHSDLPKGLAFVATFTCPYQPAWKHLSHARPAFYNATDADVELQSMEWIERRLRESGMWSVYQEDVLDLDPILVHMSAAGMPVDEEVRYERACQLAERIQDTLRRIETLVPLDARRIEHVYVDTPSDLTGLQSRPGTRSVDCCEGCGLEWPTKPHFKTFKRPTAKKPQNPCAGLGKSNRTLDVTEWFRLAPFKPSREQIIRYQEFHSRRVPTQYDKKERRTKRTTNEKAIKSLMGSYPTDPIYQLILDYRQLSKIGGTYIGFPADQEVEE